MSPLSIVWHLHVSRSISCNETHQVTFEICYFFVCVKRNAPVMVRKLKLDFLYARPVHLQPFFFCLLQSKQKKKKDEDEFVRLRTDWVPEMFWQFWVLSRSSGGVKLQSPGQLISISAATRFAASAPAAHPGFGLLSISCLHTIRHWLWQLAAERVFSQRCLICIDFQRRTSRDLERRLSWR